MDSVVIPILVVFIVALLFVSAVILNHLIYQYMIKVSPVLFSLMRLNEIYSVNLAGSVGQRYSIHIKCKNKPQFDNHSIEYAFAYYLIGHYKTYKPIYERYKGDMTEYRDYTYLYKEIAHRLPNARETGLSFTERAFRRLETKIFEKQKHKQPSLRFDVTRTYTSPKKRNHYSEHTTFYPATFNEICERIFMQQQRRKEADKERARMTPALRYQILLRDGFRCQICGRGAEDGVKLHIDHIKPVKLNGKSDPENLRTLCELCNIGKGCQYNPNGLN